MTFIIIYPWVARLPKPELIDNDFHQEALGGRGPPPARPLYGIGEMIRVVKDDGLVLVVEVDRGCHLADVRRFVRAVHLPAPLRPAYLVMFRTYVAGQGLDLDDARAVLAGHPGRGCRRAYPPGHRFP